MRKIGFTLAEILVTLGIIGVIASMTIPNLVQDIQDVQLKTAWKKAFADFAQATNMIRINNAGNLLDMCENMDNDCMRNIYLPYLNYTKACLQGKGQGNCWHDFGKFKYLNGTAISGWSHASAILNNSNLVVFRWENKKCDFTWTGSSLYRCGWIMVDVNGFKNPNIIGKDIFGINVMSTAIKPWGSQEEGITEYNCTSGSTTSGFECAAVFLYQ